MTNSKIRRALACAALAFAATLAASANAARVGVLSNAYFAETAADFGANVAGHTFTGVDVGTATPSLATLTANYDVLLLLEDLTFGNAPYVGDVVAAFAATGRAVVLGTFYDQDRSDGPTLNSPHGWGNLEKVDPNTTDCGPKQVTACATPYTVRSLDPSSLVAHPLTNGITALKSAKYAGGNDAKPGTTIVAAWTEPNARGKTDPAIDFRVTDLSCVIHVAIAPHYPSYGAPGDNTFSGDFYRAWKNAFDFAASGCVGAASSSSVIPTLSEWALALTALLLAAAGSAALRRRAKLRQR